MPKAPPPKGFLLRYELRRVEVEKANIKYTPVFRRYVWVESFSDCTGLLYAAENHYYKYLEDSNNIRVFVTVEDKPNLKTHPILG